MGKKLAIKGHPTRGKEVIELLEMLGGNNNLPVTGLRLSGTEYYCAYYIGTKGSIIYSHHSVVNDDFIIFTLEEFLEKYPFKIGDKVKDLKTDKIAEVYKIHWSENNSCVYYDIKYLNNCGCQRKLMDLKPMDDDYTEPTKMKNILAELLEHINTTPKEELEREFEEIKEWSNVGPTVEEFMAFCECVNKKPKYPKLTNLTECKEILGEKDIYQSVSGYKGELLTNFQLLLIFRDAYWKIAGEEMGLGKPWKPNWNKLSTNHKFIKINKGCFTYSSNVLVFPTEEMRDAFYENFKDLIEQCKELL